MIGQIVTDNDGNPINSNGSKLSASKYQPATEIKKLFEQVQKDYQVAYSLQHRTFDEFDGHSLLERARLDQETFSTFVGCEWVPQTKRWKWKGRKNTSRNKLIKILSRGVAGMLYPFVHAKNEENEEDKITAKVMRLLIEDALKKSKYKMKYMYMVLSALVNPAVFVSVEYVEAIQRIKVKLNDGKFEVKEVVDELMSGLALNILPIDEIMLSDFYSGTGSLQILPYNIRVRRIPWDYARSIYKNKYTDEKGTDLFDYVEAGKTKVWIQGQANETLFDIDWTEADGDYVQELTIYYRSEDLQLTWVGGVGMFNQTDPYNSNPFEHRRMVLTKDAEGKEDWQSVPVYPFGMSGFEPIDPAGRFAYYKSGAFKEYWDDKWLNAMDKFLYDGTALEVAKPLFIKGIAKVDATVIAPYAVNSMPSNAEAIAPFSTSPNIAAAYQAIQIAKEDMSDSISAEAVPPVPTPNVPATQTAAAVQQAKLFFTCFSLMIADLVEQVGALAMDCVIMNTTVGELDTNTPESLGMKYKTFLVKSKESGKDLTHKVIFSDRNMGRDMSQDDIKKREWELFDKGGGYKSDQRIYEVNPYKFARYTYTMSVDADQIILKSLGQDRQEKITDFQMLTNPAVAQFTDQQAVANEIIEEFSFGKDPDKFKNQNANNALNGMMLPGGQPGGTAVPTAQPAQGGGINSLMKV